LKKTAKWGVILVVIALLVAAVIIFYSSSRSGKDQEVMAELNPSYGEILISISTTGTVEPQNRLEIKPTIGGRIDTILVREGDRVVPGQVLAWMSSTDRAALLDAARKEGDESYKYWEETYKATPLVAPIEGEIIVRAVEPGQTVTTQDTILVISDRLIVKARVDETDIGKVQVGQMARVSLDAYPEKVVTAVVDHIAYESELVNNVTIYKVDILPKSLPPVFRSGMSANVEIVEVIREDVLTLPREAVKGEGADRYVLIRGGEGGHPVRRPVQTGLSDGRIVEIVSGVEDGDAVLIPNRKYSLPEGRQNGSNPLSPFGGRRKR
jgi:macrolide-specific efflux system membrane fusion protein